MQSSNTTIMLHQFIHSGLPADTFSIESMQGRDRIGAMYVFELFLRSDNTSIDPNDIVLKNATVVLDRKGKGIYRYSGIVTTFEFIDTSVDYTLYRAVMHPQLWKLTLTRKNRIFLKKTIPAIITELLDESGLSTYYEWQLEQTYPEREYTVQYDESDFDFISRHCETLGIRYLFDEPPASIFLAAESGSERLLLFDNAAPYQPLDFDDVLVFRSRAEMVQASQNGDTREALYELNRCRRMIPSTISVKNHNYRTPEVALSHELPVENGDMGLVYRYGGNFETVPEAQSAAQVLANRLTCGKITFEAKGDCCGLRAGCIVTVREHPRADCNGEMVITGVQHIINDPVTRKDADTLAYHSTFTAIPAAVAAHYLPEECSLPLHIPGITNAIIETNGSEYAALDEMGQYKLRMQFDRSGTANSNGTNFIREAQAYSGSGFGVHLPSHEKTEMLMGHILGNPDHPVGLGTVPNGETISPVTANNKQQSVIRTAGKNEIIMDDTDRKKKFTMNAPYDQSYSAKGDKSVIIGGDRTVTVKKNETGTVDADQKLTISGNQKVTVTGDNEITLKNMHTHEVGGNRTVKITGSRKVEVTSASRESITGNHTVETTGNCALSLKATNTVTVQGTGTLKAEGSIGAESKAILTLSAAGNVTIEGKNVNLMGIASATIVVGGSSMAISPAGIVITTPKLKIAGNEVSMGASTANMLLAGVIKIN